MEVTQYDTSQTTLAGSGLTEALFVAEAIRMGFNVSRPLGVMPYDYIIEKDGKLSRIQVKGTFADPAKNPKQLNKIMMKRSPTQTGYTISEIDFVAAYLVVADLWYVIPIAACAGLKTINLYPLKEIEGIRPQQCRFEQYRNAWHLLSGP